jgi:hypothetical protein
MKASKTGKPLCDYSRCRKLATRRRPYTAYPAREWGGKVVCIAYPTCEPSLPAEPRYLYLCSVHGNHANNEPIALALQMTASQAWLADGWVPGYRGVCSNGTILFVVKEMYETSPDSNPESWLPAISDGESVFQVCHVCQMRQTDVDYFGNPYMHGGIACCMACCQVPSGAK